MVVLVGDATVAEEQGHLRPFVAHRDLAALATLVEEAFGPELAVTGSHIVQDLRQLAALGPLLRATGPMAAPFAGFVWVEGERLVGNISLSHDRDEPDTWTVSNVAVLPEYRGRGIAGRLLDHAIAHARRQGVRRLALQVRVDNGPAQALYRHRGFRVADTLHEMQLDRHNLPVIVGASPYGLRAPAAGDRPGIRQVLARGTGDSPAPPPVGAAVEALDSPLAATFQNPALRSLVKPKRWTGLRRRLAFALTGERCLEVVARPAGQVVAYGYACTNSLRGPHDLGLYACPQGRGRWETPILEWLLGGLRQAVAQNVRAMVSAAHPEAVRAAEGLGFRTLRILDQMWLDLGPGAAPRGTGRPLRWRRAG